MTKNQENKLTMYEAVLATLTANSENTKVVPAFAPAIQEFAEVVGKIKSKTIEMRGVLAGVGADKENAEDALIESLVKICSALSDFARRAKDNALAEKAKVNESGLRRMRDTDLVSKATAIHATATEVLSNLADFGITQTMLTDLNAQINAFNAALGAREGGVAERSAVRIALAELFDNADGTLKMDLDKLIELVKKDAPQFYNAYYGARVIKDLGHRSRPKAETTPKTEPVK